MRVSDPTLDDLIRLATLAAADNRRSSYRRQLDQETVSALEELKKLRAGIPVEGTVR